MKDNSVKIFVLGGIVGAFIYHAITRSYFKGITVAYKTMSEKDENSKRDKF